MTGFKAPLPAEFKSLYRLFLRSLLRSVGNQYGPYGNLKSLFRPFFRTAAYNITRLGNAGRQTQHKNLRLWMQRWDKRADGTLALLANAGHTHGLPSTLLRQLCHLRSFAKRSGLSSRHRGTWNPQLSQDSTRYQIPVLGAKAVRAAQQEAKWKQMDEDVYNPVGEVIKLAEARSNLTLGRIFTRVYVAQKPASK
ncbi:hypothetical protein PsYK624_108080 [Phanerochaete sordida]|uniref:Uncharacterized protein n=1 Tax=Phanerochaete sordida TaxID=48140 RepID=A0A9P3GGQ9_9APHY|nr:hypothetical protein PsYK624_108080 [Phanerochaete sordida]